MWNVSIVPPSLSCTNRSPPTVKTSDRLNSKLLISSLGTDSRIFWSEAMAPMKGETYFWSKWIKTTSQAHFKTFPAKKIDCSKWPRARSFSDSGFRCLHPISLLLTWLHVNQMAQNKTLQTWIHIIIISIFIFSKCISKKETFFKVYFLKEIVIILTQFMFP